MKNRLRLFALLLGVTLASVVLVSFHKLQSKVLGESTTLLSPLEGIDKLPVLTPVPTATPSAEVTSTPSPTKVPTPKPTRKPTPTPKPQPKFTSEEIYGFTEKYGILYAVNPNVIRHLVLCESGFNPSARNSIYAGLFQFDTQTWTYYRQKMGLDADADLRYHAEEAVRTGTYILSLGKTGLWPNCYPK